MMRTDHSRVLLVGDQIQNRDGIGSFLDSGGYATGRAGTVGEALDRIRAGPVAAVVTDIRLQSQDDGLELLRRIKAEWPPLPVIVCTRFASVREAVLVTKLGATDYLEWPVDPDSILAAIRGALMGGTDHGVLNRERDNPLPLSFLPPAALARISCSNTRSSASERWARFVLKAVDSSDDPKTLATWARCAGVSYTSLREACYLVRIPPHDARDLVRALRVVLRLSRGSGRLTTLLHVSDRRGVTAFCQRTGLPMDTLSRSIPPDTFLRTQTLVPHDNEGLIALRQLLTAGAGVACEPGGSKPNYIAR
jgi:DNA-binding response OmpR family regulator